MEYRGCIMTSAPDGDGNRFTARNVEDAFVSLEQKGRLEIMGVQTPLTKVWVQTTPEGEKELWSWDAAAPRDAGEGMEETRNWQEETRDWQAVEFKGPMAEAASWVVGAFADCFDGRRYYVMQWEAATIRLTIHTPTQILELTWGDWLTRDGEGFQIIPEADAKTWLADQRYVVEESPIRYVRKRENAPRGAESEETDA